MPLILETDAAKQWLDPALLRKTTLTQPLWYRGHEGPYNF